MDIDTTARIIARTMISNKLSDQGRRDTLRALEPAMRARVDAELAKVRAR